MKVKLRQFKEISLAFHFKCMAQALKNLGLTQLGGRLTRLVDLLVICHVYACVKIAA